MIVLSVKWQKTDLAKWLMHQPQIVALNWLALASPMFCLCVVVREGYITWLHNVQTHSQMSPQGKLVAPADDRAKLTLADWVLVSSR